MQGPSFGDVFYLDGDSLVLGNNPFRADIVVRDIADEPEHAEISHTPGIGYVLKDLGTGEPTIVNEEAVEEE
ncbi:MAG: FHA domain-containing protein, partial [Rubrobacteraceae bacterium]